MDNMEMGEKAKAASFAENAAGTLAMGQKKYYSS
jgi:hypothetical protein